LHRWEKLAEPQVVVGALLGKAGAVIQLLIFHISDVLVRAAVPFLALVFKPILTSFSLVLADAALITVIADIVREEPSLLCLLKSIGVLTVAIEQH
jgi:hypothetical protein